MGGVDGTPGGGGGGTGTWHINLLSNVKPRSLLYILGETDYMYHGELVFMHVQALQGAEEW